MNEIMKEMWKSESFRKMYNGPKPKEDRYQVQTQKPVDQDAELTDEEIELAMALMGIPPEQDIDEETE